MPKSKVVAALLVVLALAACSGSDKKPAPGTSGKIASTAPTSSSSSSTEAASGPEMTLLATEPLPDVFAFDTTGTESLPAGTIAVTLSNVTTVAHEARIIRIRDADFNSFKAAVLAQGAFVAASLGDVVFATPTVAAGDSTSGTATLTAGTYAIVCLLPGPDGTSFAESGMINRLDVTPSTSSTSSTGSSSSGSSSSTGSSSTSSSSS